LLPFSWAMKLGGWTGHLLFYALPRYRKAALENLTHVFGGKSKSEIKRIAVQSFKHLGLFAVEFVRIPKIVKNLNRYVVIKNEDSVFHALRAGKGVILIVSHFGNWEWMGIAAGARARQKEVQINAVARALGNPFLYRYAVNQLRGATGLRTIHKRGAAREAMKLLGQNEIVCILIDQHERYASVPVPFFGRDAWTTTLPAMLAVKKGVPVIPVFSFRRNHQATLVELGEPFPVIRTGDYEQDLIENTRQYVQAIEEVVRAHPSEWLWMHARWRTSRTAKANS